MSDTASRPASDPVHIRVVDVHKSFGTHHVLRGVSFDIYRGSINMIMGGSGAGKTVMMRNLIRLDTPDSGRIEVDGVDIASLGPLELLPFRARFGMVFQMSALFDSMSVFDNVAFPLREHTRMSKADLRERVMSRLAALHIEKAAQKSPSELSGGMQKRVALARALAMEPEILIYDEPTTGLDPVTSRTVDDLITETAERFGVTSIVISHDMASVFRSADHISFLLKGEIAASGSPRELLAQRPPAIMEFLEASGVDPATLERSRRH